MKKILTSGVLRNEIVIINKNTAEVTIRGNLKCNDQEFENVPILRLIIERVYYDYVAIYVEDEYCQLIPYLKPIKAFREFIKENLFQLLKEINDRQNLVYQGIEKYLRDLENFPEINTLVREVKSEVNRLKSEKAHVKDMRKILEILGKTSAVDNHFEVVKTKKGEGDD